MKKFYITLIALASVFVMNAQLANLNLNTWTAGFGYDTPDGWTCFNQYASFLGINPHVVKLTSNVSEGSAAAEMFTQDCPSCPGISAQIPDPLPGILIQSTGYYSNTASTFEFDYQYEGVSGDWGLAMVQLSVWDPVGDSAIIIGQAIDTLGATTTTWTTRSVDFVYSFPSLVPDTINIYFVSSAYAVTNDPNFPASQDGSILRVDNVKINDPATASINEVENHLNAYYYNNLITIKVENEQKLPYEILDISGKIVHQAYTNGSTTLVDTEDLKPGVYLISLHFKDRNLIQKVFVE